MWRKPADAVFEKEGKQIPYRKASLTRAGYALDENTPVDLAMKEKALPSAQHKRNPIGPERRSRAPLLETGARRRSAAQAREPAGETETRLEAALRAWRVAEARRRGLPAYCIFNDRALQALAVRRPSTDQELLGIPGIGMSTLEKYGKDISRVLRENGG